MRPVRMMINKEKCHIQVVGGGCERKSQNSVICVYIEQRFCWEVENKT